MNVLLLIIFAAPAALGIALAARGWIWSRRVPVSNAQPESTAATADPRCGQCGYIVRGIASLNCPECGSDLREVGIDVGRRASAGWAWAAALGAVVLWSLMVWGAWEAAGEALQRAAPRVRTASYTVTLNRPDSGAYTQIQIDGSGARSVATPPASSGSAAANPPDAPNLKITLLADRGVIGTLTADVAADTFSYTGPDGTRVGPRTGFGQAAVLEWLTRCTGSTDPRLAAEARDVATVGRTVLRQGQGIIQMRGGGSYSSSSSGPGSDRTESGSWSISSTGGGNFTSANGSYRVTEQSAAWVAVAALIAGLAVWLAGTAWLLQRFGPRRPGQAQGTAGPVAG